MKLLSLFSGIGAFEEGLKNLEIPYSLVNYCEFDKEVAKAYSLIHNTPLTKNLGDIRGVDVNSLEDFNLLTYGFPCQDISALGKMTGLKKEDGSLTRSGLFFEAMRIVKEKNPEFLIAENVRALLFKKHSSDFNRMLELLDSLGYNTYYKILNAKDYNLPHSRGRVFLVSIRKDIDVGFIFPKKQPLRYKAKDFYDKGFVGEKYYTTEQHKKYFNEFRLQKKYSSLNADIIICQTTKQGHLSNPQNFIKDIHGVRMLTPMEMFALQGFKKTYALKCMMHGISSQKLGYMSGNSISVPVIEAILKSLKEQYRGYFN